MERVGTEALVVRETFTVGLRRYSIEIQPDREPGFQLIRVESDDGLPSVEFKARLLASSGRARTLEVDGQIEDLLLLADGRRTLVERAGSTYDIQKVSSRDKLRTTGLSSEDQGPVVIKAHMPGKIVRLMHKPGEEVAAGEGVIVIEAMKMQNEIKAPKSGILVKYLAKVGGNVNAGDPLCEVE
jgi:biotin carboxyl carrier protein